MIVVPVSDDYDARMRASLASGREAAMRDQGTLVRIQRFALVSSLALGTVGALIGYGRKRTVDGALDGVRVGAFVAFVVSTLYGISEVIAERP